MTLEEKAEEYVQSIEGDDCVIIKDREERKEAYLAGAEEVKADCDFALEGRDVKIMELEQKLEQTEKDLADYQFNYPTIKELEKENAELKEQNNHLYNDLTMTEAENAGRKDQLTKAKELLNEFMKYEINEYDGSLEIHFEELKKQTEQFIKEIEK